MYGHSDIFTHRTIGELRDMLGNLKADARFLAQDRELGDSVAVFYSLSLENRLTLLYLALTEGDRDVQNIAHRLMGTLALDSIPQTPKDLLVMLTARSRAELAKLNEVGTGQPGEPDRLRIAEHLKEACNRIGSLQIEEAFWILVLGRSGEGTTWIQASGSGAEPRPGLRLAFYSQVIFSLTEREMNNLLATVKRSRWALHVHNHPASRSANYISLCAPSGTDEQSASRWRSIRPGLGHKMKFFVIQNEKAVEYALPQGRTERWF